jgi:hypothetical protein
VVWGVLDLRYIVEGRVEQNYIPVSYSEWKAKLEKNLVLVYRLTPARGGPPGDPAFGRCDARPGGRRRRARVAQARGIARFASRSGAFEDADPSKRSTRMS